MKTLVCATNNAHKLSELRQMLGQHCNILSLKDINCNDDIPEDGLTFEDNALAKARWVKERYGYDCFADDSGLEVDALDGAPGVHSARYAGGHGDSEANNALLLERLNGISDRTARFRCVIALLQGNDAPKFFSGSVEGSIIESPDGTAGFGYDPLFRPAGWDKTFAQADADEKNAISHRGRAVQKLVEYLKE